MSELSGGIRHPKEIKLCHFVLLAFSQLSYLTYLTGSREMRSIAYAARALVSLMRITGRAASAARALANQMQPPEATLRVNQRVAVEAGRGEPEPIAGIKNISN